MPKQLITMNVFDAALERISVLYEQGHRVVVCFSAGKDSGIILELAILAASMSNRLPVEVALRDEEIMLPGTYEYAERVAAREEIDFHWQIPNHPIINYFSRGNPYWWTFDPALEPEQWVRQYPSYAYHIPEIHIQGMVTSERFPPAPGKELYCLVGLRTSESRNRALGLQSSGGYITQRNPWGARNARPIYDWSDGDVWKAIFDNKWDYNNAYDVMHRKGVHRSKLRIAPPTMAIQGIKDLRKAAEAWPQWFDKVEKRLPGLRTAAQFGERAVAAIRRNGETWEDCYKRSCIQNAPKWISERAQKVMAIELENHRRHSTQPYPQTEICLKCPPMLGSWRSLTKVMYMGDPFSLKQGYVPLLDPEFFRPGSGTWGKGKPSF